MVRSGQRVVVFIVSGGTGIVIRLAEDAENVIGAEIDEGEVKEA